MRIDNLSLNDIKKCMDENSKFYRAGREESDEFGVRCLEVIWDNKLLESYTNEQERFLVYMFDHMDAVTATHCIEAAKLGKNLVESYGEEAFKRDCGIDKDSFVKGLLIHDAGKLMVDGMHLLTSRKLEPAEKNQVSKHNVYAEEVMQLINTEANPGVDLTSVWDPSITAIATFHHPKDNVNEVLVGPEDASSYTSDKLPRYLFVAAEVDIYESLLSDNRTYKEPKTHDGARKIVNFDIEDYAKNESKFYSVFKDKLESCYESDFHKELKESFKKDLSVTEMVGKYVDEALNEQKEVEFVKIEELDNKILYDIDK